MTPQLTAETRTLLNAVQLSVNRLHFDLLDDVIVVKGGLAQAANWKFCFL